MNIDKAIKILALGKTFDYEGPGQDLEDALQLGIEALKFRLRLEQTAIISSYKPLPGETRE